MHTVQSTLRPTFYRKQEMIFIVRFRVTPCNHVLEFHYQRSCQITWKECGRCAHAHSKWLIFAVLLSVNYYARPQLGVSDTASWSVEWIF